MPNLGKQVFYAEDGHRYELDLEFDDSELMENSLTFALTASKYAPGTEEGPNAEPLERLPAKVQIMPMDGVAIVTIGEEIEFRIEIGNESLADHPGRPIEEAEEHEDYWREIARASGRGDEIADLIDLLPTGDPFVGCLVKAGISTVIGQSVSCYLTVRGEIEATPWEEKYRPWAGPVRRFLQCMKANGLRMLGRTAIRTGRCVLRMGFG